MDPLQGWGPPPWSLAPKAGVLRLALLCVLLGALLCEGRPPCREEEFPVGAMCCPRCSPGHRVKEACGETRRTVCAPCSPGTYTAHRNGLDECLPCHLCDPGRGQVTRRKCSSTGNTVCGCKQGHFCVLVDGDDCVECRPHSDCRPGQRVQQTGTEWQDTVCEDCPPGTFSAGGTQAVCEPWTNCSGLFKKEAKPGTNSTDVTCSSSVKVVIVCACSVIAVSILHYLVFQMYSYCRIRRSCEETDQGTHGDQVSLVLPDITPMAVEETASMFPESDPQLMNASGCRRLSISMGPADCSRPLRAECGDWGAAGTHPGWLSLHWAEEGTGHCSGGFGDHTYDPFQLLWCLESSSHPLLSQHPEVTPTGQSRVRGTETSMREDSAWPPPACPPWRSGPQPGPVP